MLGSVAEQSVADRILISCEGEWYCPCLSRSGKTGTNSTNLGANDLLRMKVRTLQWRKYATSPHKSMTLTPDPSRGTAETLWVRLQVGGRQSCRVTAAPRLGSGVKGSRFCGETAQKRGRKRATTRGEGVWSNGVEANLCSARHSTQRPVRVYRGCLPGLAAPAQWEGLCLRCHLKGQREAPGTSVWDCGRIALVACARHGVNDQGGHGAR